MDKLKQTTLHLELYSLLPYFTSSQPSITSTYNLPKPQYFFSPTLSNEAQQQTEITLCEVLKSDTICLTLLRMLQSELLLLRPLNKQLNAIVESYYQAWYVQYIDTFPKPYLNFPIMYKIVNTFSRAQNSNAKSTCYSLIKASIFLNEKEMILAAVRMFMNKVRMTKQHRDYVVNRKQLNDRILQELLANQNYISFSIYLNNNSMFNYFLKECQQAKQDIQFSNRDLKRMMHLHNQTGNLEILRFLFSQNKLLYLQVLISLIEDEDMLKHNWLVFNTLLGCLDVLDFNLKLLELNQGRNYLNSQAVIVRLFEFCLLNNKLEEIRIFGKYTDFLTDRYCHEEKTPLEFISKYFNNELEPMFTYLIDLEEKNQDKIRERQNKKCYLTTMIKRNLPISLIQAALSLYTDQAISSYRDDQNKSLLYHAIEQNNMFLVKLLYKKFSAEAYQEFTSFGTSTHSIAKKHYNYDIRKLITNYVENREVEAFIENEQAKDPSIPRNLIILKRKLKLGEQKQQQIKLKLSNTHLFKFQVGSIKPKRSKSLQPDRMLYDFEMFTLRIEERMLRKGLAKIEIPDLSTIKSEPKREPRKLCYESKNSCFRSIKTFTKDGIYYTESDFLQFCPNLITKFREIYKTKLYLSELPFISCVVPKYLYLGAKYIDNADIYHKDYINLRTIPDRNYHQMLMLRKRRPTVSRASGTIASSLQNFFQRQFSFPKLRDEKDQVLDLITQQINNLKQTEAKYQDLSNSDLVDPSKATIAQKIEIQKLKDQNKKVQAALQKNFIEKLKFQMEKDREGQEQNEIEQDMISRFIESQQALQQYSREEESLKVDRDGSEKGNISTTLSVGKRTVKGTVSSQTALNKPLLVLKPAESVRQNFKPKKSKRKNFADGYNIVINADQVESPIDSMSNSVEKYLDRSLLEPQQSSTNLGLSPETIKEYNGIVQMRSTGNLQAKNKFFGSPSMNKRDSSKIKQMKKFSGIRRNSQQRKESMSATKNQDKTSRLRKFTTTSSQDMESENSSKLKPVTPRHDERIIAKNEQLQELEEVIDEEQSDLGAENFLSLKQFQSMQIIENSSSRMESKLQSQMQSQKQVDLSQDQAHKRYSGKNEIQIQDQDEEEKLGQKSLRSLVGNQSIDLSIKDQFSLKKELSGHTVARNLFEMSKSSVDGQTSQLYSNRDSAQPITYRQGQELFDLNRETPLDENKLDTVYERQLSKKEKSIILIQNQKALNPIVEIENIDAPQEENFQVPLLEPQLSEEPIKNQAIDVNLNKDLEVVSEDNPAKDKTQRNSTPSVPPPDLTSPKQSSCLTSPCKDEQMKSVKKPIKITQKNQSGDRNKRILPLKDCLSSNKSSRDNSPYRNQAITQIEIINNITNADPGEPLMVVPFKTYSEQNLHKNLQQQKPKKEKILLRINQQAKLQQIQRQRPHPVFENKKLINLPQQSIFSTMNISTKFQSMSPGGLMNIDVNTFMKGRKTSQKKLQELTKYSKRTKSMDTKELVGLSNQKQQSEDVGSGDNRTEDTCLEEIGEGQQNKKKSKSPKKRRNLSQHNMGNLMRYKDEVEEQQIKKIVKNINVLRRMAGSPLRLYPELCSPQKLKSRVMFGNQPKFMSPTQIKHETIYDYMRPKIEPIFAHNFSPKQEKQMHQALVSLPLMPSRQIDKKQGM